MYMNNMHIFFDRIKYSKVHKAMDSLFQSRKKSRLYKIWGLAKVVISDLDTVLAILQCSWIKQNK